jgi:hypothetical protein
MGNRRPYRDKRYSAKLPALANDLVMSIYTEIVCPNR